MRRRFRRTTTEADRSTLSARPEPQMEPELETGPDGGAEVESEAGELDFDQLLARELEQADAPSDSQGDAPSDDGFAAEVEGPPPSEPLPGDFWDQYDLAVAEAELAQVPPAAVVTVIGPLDAVVPVAERCRDRHWMGDCDVFVLTQRRIVPSHPEWTVVGQPSELVAVLEDGGSDFPLLVLDVPCDLPAFVRPLVARLREQGVGLVHYVLDDDPVDEDLATWHGELGQPSVLDLAGSVDAGRVLELVDRGEPVVSVAGQTLTTELLLALRVEQAAVSHSS